MELVRMLFICLLFYCMALMVTIYSLLIILKMIYQLKITVEPTIKVTIPKLPWQKFEQKKKMIRDAQDLLANG